MVAKKLFATQPLRALAGTLVHSTGPTPNLYLYAGEQWDADLAQYYLRARYMEPNTGRFFSRELFEGISSAVGP